MPFELDPKQFEADLDTAKSRLALDPKQFEVDFQAAQSRGQESLFTKALSKLSKAPPELAAGAKQMIDAGVQVYKGESEFDYKEMPSMYKGKIGIQSMLATAMGNPIAEAAIYNKAFPEEEIASDKFGNIYVTDPNSGESHYLNRSGFSRGDVIKFGVGDALPAGGAAGGAQLGVKMMAKMGGKGMIGQGLGAMMGGGIGAGAGQAATEQVSRWLGYKGERDMGTTALYMGMGAVGEALSPLMNAFIPKYLKKVVKNGKITPYGEKVLRANHINIPQIAREAGKSRTRVLNDFEKRWNNPAEYVGFKSTKKHRFPLTKGLADPKNLEQQAWEQAALNSARGTKSAQVIGGAVDDMHNKMRQAVMSFKNTMGQGIEDVGVGAGDIMKKGRQLLEQRKEQSRRLFKSAKAKRAQFEPGRIGKFYSDMDFKMNDDGFIDFPVVGKMLNRLKEISQAPMGVDIKLLERWRKRVTRQSHAAFQAMNDELGTGLKIMRDSYDDMMTDRAILDFMHGDLDAPKAWRDAIADRAEWGRLFNPNKVMRNLFTDPDMGSKEALNSILGISQTGAKIQARRNVKALKKIFPDAMSPEGKVIENPHMKGLRDEMFHKLMDKQPAEGFSPTRFKTKWERWYTYDKELMQELFTSKQLRDLNDLAKEISQGIYQAEATNMSRTSYGMARLFTDLGGIPGGVVNSLSQGSLERMKDTLIDLFKARSASSVAKRELRWLPEGMGPMLATIMGDELREGMYYGGEDFRDNVIHVYGKQ